MKKTLLTMAAALALVGCARENLLPNGYETVADGKVGANIFVPATTRGAALNTADDLIGSQKGFDLISYYNDGSGNYELFMGATDDGIRFMHDGSAWDYAERGEIHFWQTVSDDATDMKFFAVSPAKEYLPNADVTSDGSTSYSIGADAQTITYTVPTTVSEQVDLMFAQTDLADGEYEPTSEVYRNGVPLNFHHALSQIVFKARIADKEDTDLDGTSDHVTAYVNSISVKNVHGTGTFDMAAASAILGETEYRDGGLEGMDYTNDLWDTSAGTADVAYTVSELTNNEGIDWIDAADLTDGAIDTETAMLLLPQQLNALDLSGIGTDVNSANEEQIISAGIDLTNAGAYLEVNCRVEYTGTDGTTTYIVGEDAESFANIYIPISTNWQPGYKYVYTLIFSADSGDPVKAYVDTVDEWNTAEEIEKPGEEEDDNSMKYVSTASFTGFQIYTAEQLAQVRDLINSGASYEVDDDGNITTTRAAYGQYEYANYKLMADIDLSDYDNWEPIGYNSSFRGSFDGNGKKIYNVNIDLTQYDNSQIPEDEPINLCNGLFGYTYGASIKNISVIGSYTAAVMENVSFDMGGIVGRADNTTIENCHFDGSILIEDGDNYNMTHEIGGIVGLAMGESKIVGCTNSADVVSEDTFQNMVNAGGIVGRIFGNCTIAACYNAGKVSIASDRSVGGIVGTSSNLYEKISIISCGNYSTDIIRPTSDEHPKGVGTILGGDIHNEAKCSLEACYSIPANDLPISGNDGDGISTTNCGTVDGSELTWCGSDDVQNAMDMMNNALIELAEEDGTGLYEWHFEPGSGDTPLVLKKGLAS